MRRASAMLMAVALVAASSGPGVIGYGAGTGPGVRGSSGPPPPRPKGRPSMRGCWNPAGGIEAARRNRLKGRKGRRR